MIKTRFGFLNEPSALKWSGGEIEPLGDHTRTVDCIRLHERVYGEWVYPPLQSVERDGMESKCAPLMPVGFALPATHLLLLDGEGGTDECANFFIALFGMLKGRRLQREGWQHFYKAPLTRKLNDFLASDREIKHALSIASAFWDQCQQPVIRKLIFGVVHWHLFAQLYSHEFERFNAQYAAFDACSKLAVELGIPGYQQQPRHGERPEKLCEALGVQIPEWARSRSGKCDLSERRNTLVHEAMYADQPIGFSFPMENSAMELELTGLVARIYLRLLGIKNEYTASPCTIRQTIGFTFTE